MQNAFLFILFSSLLGCSNDEKHDCCNTYKDVVTLVQNDKPVIIGILGNSIGNGQFAKTNNGHPFDTKSMLIQTQGPTYNMLTNFGPHLPVEGWANQFYAYLLIKNRKSVVINYSGSAWDTADQLGANPGTFGFAMQNNVALFINMKPKPHAILLPLQVNDFSHGLSVKKFTENYSQIINQLIAAGIVPIVVLENPIYNNKQLAGKNGAPLDVNQSALTNHIIAAKTMADARGLGVIDFFTPIDNLAKQQVGADYGTQLYKTGLFSDSNIVMHPIQAGHNLMANISIDFFKQNF